ncbi:ArsO family NAD(P)H-dependent flavin-containing monooxygenase [Psychroflexus sp. CAK57W]|uniref:ArsO family NAD(P)H-dependent flavin-containing monooxygenase n=1 Tax=Psychroflexus curvus TaxID=2873595 RepID=UPI001CCE80DD|nr:ArsO family NAD(P)H-dependent flavin-containing monooxygenase [Psychroflexus curvus]MBZ9627219.1 ArsO family NAD(P)H-dependent flavin-containing monooxygenase [Psychroflexus curvus]MBZ9787213.1 ArsO family NAD(P)H-dependent flavin-containing monooxygenase [Psychroflexus curvus]
MADKTFDLILIGGGQSALACAFFLRRKEIDYIILDDQETCGGSWKQTWESLTLFSPPEHSSLPGWQMPESEGEFPTKEETIDYLCQYEDRYDFPIQRPVKVKSIDKKEGMFTLETTEGQFNSKTVISATGTYKNPFIPEIPGRDKFEGKQLHSSDYRSPEEFKDKKIVIVGEGNSGAQILAEISKVAKTFWSTKEEPQFLPDDVDGRVLFDMASAKYYAEKKGEKYDSTKFNLGNIVMVPSVKEARERDVLHSQGQIQSITKEGVVWEDGSCQKVDVIIWCTGFGYSTGFLENLVSIDHKGKIPTDKTKAKETDGLWLVGYGGWTGFASATLIGVGRYAKQTIKEVSEYLKD